MGIFGFFSKEKKESLDQGLQKTNESIFSKLSKAVVGKSKVDEEVLDELEEVLIGSDLGVETTLKVIKRIEERVARDKYLNASELDSILREEKRYLNDCFNMLMEREYFNSSKKKLLSLKTFPYSWHYPKHCS